LRDCADACGATKLIIPAPSASAITALVIQFFTLRFIKSPVIKIEKIGWCDCGGDLDQKSTGKNRRRSAGLKSSCPRRLNLGSCKKRRLNNGVPRNVGHCHCSRFNKILRFDHRCRDRKFLKNAIGVLMRTCARDMVDKLAREMMASSKAMDHSRCCNCKKNHHQRNYYTVY
jgi:hypothetical protein